MTRTARETRNRNDPRDGSAHGRKNHRLGAKGDDVLGRRVERRFQWVALTRGGGAVGVDTGRRIGMARAGAGGGWTQRANWMRESRRTFLLSFYRRRFRFGGRDRVDRCDRNKKFRLSGRSNCRITKVDPYNR